MFRGLEILRDAASDYAQKTLQNRRLVRADIPRLGELVLHTKAFRWRSDFFEKSAGVHPSRAESVIDSVFYDVKARREVKRAIDSLGGAGSAAFWDVYLRRSVNTVMGFSEEYLSLLKLAHSALPDKGILVDWNCGTGNLASALLLAAPERTVHIVDSNPRAVMAAKRLLKYFFPQGGNFTTKVGSPGDGVLNFKNVEGALLQNALFLLEGDGARQEWLQRLADSTVDGGRVLLLEPKPSLQKQSILRLWIQRLVHSSTRNYSPANEFDIALFTEVQRRIFSSAPGSIPTTKELV